MSAGHQFASVSVCFQGNRTPRMYAKRACVRQLIFVSLDQAQLSREAFVQEAHMEAQSTKTTEVQNFVFEGFDMGLDAEMAADPAESIRKA